MDTAAWFTKYAVSAVQQVMPVIREAQLRPRGDQSVDRKEGGKIVTPLDVQVEEILRRKFQEALPEIKILGEEKGGSKDYSSLLIVVDSIDGSRAYAHGLPTSTVMVGLYDGGVRQVIASVVGLPSTGQIWSAKKGKGCFYHHAGGEKFPCRAWDGPLGQKASVYLQVSRGSSRPGPNGGEVEIISAQNVGRMISELSTTGRGTFLPGSTGLNLAMLAWGGEGMAGCICHADGGPWDLTPVLLPIEAGGSAIGFSRSTKGWEKVDPLNIFARDGEAYDILVVGNSEETANQLSDCIMKYVS